MNKASTKRAARAEKTDDRTAAAKELQRLYRASDRVFSTIRFRPSDLILYPDPNRWMPPDLKD